MSTTLTLSVFLFTPLLINQKIKIRFPVTCPIFKLEISIEIIHNCRMLFYQYAYKFFLSNVINQSAFKSQSEDCDWSKL